MVVDVDSDRTERLRFEPAPLGWWREQWADDFLTFFRAVP